MNFAKKFLIPFMLIGLLATITIFAKSGHHKKKHPPLKNLTGSVVIVAAGDISGSSTSKLIGKINPNAVLTLGDNAYQNGSSSDYKGYAKTWGKYKNITFPSPGNHDHNSGLSGYKGYFGNSLKPPYSFNLADWHMISLDSSASVSSQSKWLKRDLASVRNKCILAYWHYPLFSSGSVHGGTGSVKKFWKELEKANADIVLNGHEHNYERFAPQTSSGKKNARGIREFVVGTGGISHYGFGGAKKNSEKRIAGTYGVLQLELSKNSYSWKFVATSGGTKDSGRGNCHLISTPPVPTPTPPPVPTTPTPPPVPTTPTPPKPPSTHAPKTVRPKPEITTTVKQETTPLPVSKPAPYEPVSVENEQIAQREQDRFQQALETSSSPTDSIPNIVDDGGTDAEPGTEPETTIGSIDTAGSSVGKPSWINLKLLLLILSIGAFGALATVGYRRF